MALSICSLGTEALGPGLPAPTSLSFTVRRPHSPQEGLTIPLALKTVSRVLNKSSQPAVTW